MERESCEKNTNKNSSYCKGYFAHNQNWWNRNSSLVNWRKFLNLFQTTWSLVNKQIELVEKF